MPTNGQTNQSPDQVLCLTDPGDDTQRRFRYQSTQAAILALALLREDTELVEVFCELHEDVLLKKRSGDFIGYQVKTRHDGAEPLRATDEETVKALRRFLALDTRFGSQFSRYVLASSCGFWKERKDGKNLPHLLELAESSSNGSLPRPLEAYLVKIFSPPTSRPRRGQRGPAAPATTSNPGTPTPEQLRDQTLRVVRKVKTETLPGLRDIDSALIKAIRQLPSIGDRLYSELELIAHALVAATFKASSLAHSLPQENFISLYLNPTGIITDEIINGKRIHGPGLLATINAALPVQPTLCTSNHLSVESMPRGMSRLELKLAASGVSLANIDLAKDLKASTEYLLTQLQQKYPKKISDAQYQHLRTLVRTECQEAHDQAKKVNQLYGPAMLESIRQRLRVKHQTEGDTLYGCRYEHLMGMAAILTEDCTLWWSDTFPLGTEAQP